nr:MAG TPA: hypothetical protein [Caudoviricetes sp.]
MKNLSQKFRRKNSVHKKSATSLVLLLIKSAELQTFST